MKNLVMTLTLVGFGSALSLGCASADRARADYHNRRAKEEAKNMNLGKAIDEKQKANEAERDARHDPLP